MHSTVTAESVSLPGFPVSLAESLLAQRLERGMTSLIREFRSSIA